MKESNLCVEVKKEILVEKVNKVLAPQIQINELQLGAQR
jgi:hypothetical protein